MATFTEFRNSFPESSNEKGERFEIFLSEWMFKHHPALSSQYKKVWRFSEWPGAWSQKDLGTDLIAEDQHGKICAIQAKFYKEKNSIPKSHIDSFLSDSNREGVDYRLLIATTDNLGPNARKTIEGQEKEVQTFLLHHFLEPFEWPESIDSLEDYQPRQPHQPRPHQQAAIDDVCAKIEGRGQLLMACGTGKTLTGQRITEALESQTTLVLLPSLLLLSKTVADWVSEKEKDFIYLPVCSDKSVTKKTDEISLNNSELCFRSTTDSTEIARFLKRSERKVVFSTYQSSPQIAEAFKTESLKPFDLIIADEAHRCAGKVSSDYGTVLSENLIPAEKRLFMTATPRTYSSRLKQNAMDAEVQVASMDDEQVFGPVLHHLTFGQAIESDPPLLTDYRVVVVGVNDALVREQVEERAFVKTESGLEDDARSLAIQIGLSKAIKDFDLKRVISFHGRVNYASEFASSFKRLQDDLKSDSKPTGKIEYGYVSGSMPTSQRTRELRALAELANEDRYIVGNARCLSEGVDVPALDGVAFVDPKRSEIDIVQAVGRAMRLAEGKSFGTIIIPVFISDEEDPDEALSNSEFDQVWKVVNALRAHDESLGEKLDDMRRQLGRKQGVSFRGSKLTLDLPTTVGEEFLEALECRLVQTCSSSWEECFGALTEFYSQYGHTDVPQKLEIGDIKLGQWVVIQRTAYRERTLSQERISRLDAANFIWNSNDQKWYQGFASLQQFRDTHGDCLVPIDFILHDFHLGRWVNKQRSQRANLSSDRLRLLDSVNFIWDVSDLRWNEGFDHLIRYKERVGDCLVPESFSDGNYDLGRWVGKQRQTKKRGKLSDDRIAKLDQLGFIWDVNDFRWSTHFSALTEYKSRYGDCSVNPKYVVNGIELGKWVNRQRSNRKLGRMSADQIEKIDSLGFDWDPVTDDPWDARYQALSEYHSIHGNCRVAQGQIFNGVSLGQWVSVLRQHYKNSKLSSSHIEQLESLGFEWEIKDDLWVENYEALKDFKIKNGHCMVPKDYEVEGRKLGQWVMYQRSSRGKSINSQDRMQKLRELGFIFDVHKALWDTNFAALEEYKIQTGHCRVPKNFEVNGLKLGQWVSKQRSKYKSNKLSREQIQALDSVAFDYSIK